MSTSDEMRLRAVIHGRVQGVGFRAFVLQHAANLGVSGWVRNTYRGDVEVVAEGRREILERLLKILESGPRSSYITAVDSQWEPAAGEFDGFDIRF